MSTALHGPRNSVMHAARIEAVASWIGKSSRILTRQMREAICDACGLNDEQLDHCLEALARWPDHNSGRPRRRSGDWRWLMNAAIDYRMPPAYLATRSIVAELLWIGNLISWPGPIGDHARERATALRSELRRREWVDS